MARSLAAGVTTETTESDVRIAVFAQFDFSSGDVFLWSGVGSLTTSALGTMPAATWQGTGTLGSVSAIEETAELRAAGMTFVLDGLDSSILSIALGEHYQGRAATIWLAFFDDSWAIIANPVQVYSGRMDQMELSDEGTTATVKLSVENRLIDLERNNHVRYYTAQDQKRAFPGDKGFDYVTSLQEKVIFWGKHVLAPSKGPGTTGSSPTSGGGSGGGLRPPSVGGGVTSSPSGPGGIGGGRR